MFRPINIVDDYLVQVLAIAPTMKDPGSPDPSQNQSLNPNQDPNPAEQVNYIYGKG